MAVYQNLSVTQLSQDVEQNCSAVRILWQSTQTGASYNAIEDVGHYTLFVNGQEQFTRDVTFVLPMNTTQTIVDVEEKIFHNAKGEAEVTVQTWMNTHISAGIVELNQTVKLDDIPQASTLTASDGQIGGSSRLAVTRRNGDFSHSVSWSFGQLQGYVTAEGQISQEEVIFTAEGVDFFLPESFYQQIPDAQSGICTLTLRTYSGSVQIGSEQTARFTVMARESDCCPQVWGAVTDANAVTVALTGDERTLVRYHSSALCTISAEARKSAWLTQKRIQGSIVQEDSLTVEKVQTDQFRFAVTDSRGYTGEYLVQTGFVPYVQLSCEAAAQRSGPASTEGTLTVTGDYYNASFGQQDNAISVSYSLDGKNFLPVETSLSGHRYQAVAQLTDMDYTRLYTLTVRVSDRLMQLEKQVVLKKGVPTFDWGEKDFAFHVPVGMDTPLALESGGTGSSDARTALANLGLSFALEPGVEYLTAEYWNGRPVYTRLVDFGTMPNAGSTALAHNAAATAVLRCFGATSDGRTLPWGSMKLYCDRQKIYMETQSDESACTAQVQIYYTKD